MKEKTFSFLGGSESKYEPLIDTTSSEFDSLFTVGSDQDISIVQEVDNFDIGSLDNALDEAGGDLSVSDQFDQNLLANSDLISQQISASYDKENQVYTSGDPAALAPAPFSDDDGDDEITVTFPAPRTSTDDVLEAPNFGTVDASKATVESVTITDEPLSDLNEITFTISNNGSNTLTDGNRNPPEIQVEGVDGNTSRESFSDKVAPSGNSGDQANAVVDVSGLTLGDGAQYRLFVAGTDEFNTADLEVDLSSWRYQAATLSDAQNVEISASSDNPILTAGSNASDFEGINVDGGTITLNIDRTNPNRDLGSFDPEINNLDITNGTTPDFANVNPFDTGARSGNTIDMGAGNGGDGSGIAATVNVNSLTSSPMSGTVTFGAGDIYTISIDGQLDIKTMFFRPDGETIQTSGDVALNNDRLTFEQGDFVKISNAVIEATNLTIDPEVDFDTLAFSYPDLRRKNIDGQGPDYQPQDSLEVRFLKDGFQDSPFEFDQADLEGGFTLDFENIGENIGIFPPGESKIRFTLFGRLESDPNAEAIVSAGDGASATTSVGDFDIQELGVSQADPFSVAVTSDADQDGEIDLANDDEARTASFEGFDSFSDRVDGLELADVSLDFSVTTRNLTSTDAQLYTAIQGKNDTESTFLAGTAGDRDVTNRPSFENQLVNEGNPLSDGSLIKLGVDLGTVPLRDSTTQPVPINETNSTVGDFINTLPTSIRLIGQARMNTKTDPLQLQRPIELDAGFTVDVPLQIESEFVVQDTIDADFSDLDDLTNREEDLQVSKLELQFDYTNGLPLGPNVSVTIADDTGTAIETYSGDNLQIKPAPTTDGAADGTESGTFILNLGDTQEALRNLADGREMQLSLNMTQESQNQAARLRADDTITFNQIRLNAKATIDTGD